MEITNLSQTPTESDFSKKSVENSRISFSMISIVAIIAITAGFFLSRFFPGQKGNSLIPDVIDQKNVISSTDNITSGQQIEVGKTYGNTSKDFSDSATGTVQAGSINGEGTHILVRDGGLSQRVSLISSTIDLDLFVDRKVEAKGQTNASSKTGWLLDVGSIKVLE